MCDDLIAAHGNLPGADAVTASAGAVGSDRILAAMNRKHTRAEYLGAIARLRAARADIAFTSDFIVGFPGETEQDFRDTLSLAEEVNFATAYTFKCTRRARARRPPRWRIRFRKPEKSERLQRLQAIITRQWQAFNRSFIGKTMDILVREARQTHWATGRPLPISSVRACDGAAIADRNDRKKFRLPTSGPTLCSAN